MKQLRDLLCKAELGNHENVKLVTMSVSLLLSIAAASLIDGKIHVPQGALRCKAC